MHMNDAQHNYTTYGRKTSPFCPVVYWVHQNSWAHLSQGFCVTFYNSGRVESQVLINLGGFIWLLKCSLIVCVWGFPPLFFSALTILIKFPLEE